MSPNLNGALMMIASMLSFTTNDTFIKLTDGAVPLSQLLFLRGVMTTVLVLGLAYYLGQLQFKLPRRDWSLVILRSVAEVLAAYFFLFALFKMPLGNLTAVLQSLPLTLTLCSALFFGEPVGWRRMLAIAVGFCGVVLIVGPGVEGFDISSIYALLAVVAVTVRDLATRQLSTGVSGLSVTLATSVAVTVASGLASLAEPSVDITTNNFMYIAASALAVMAGYYFSVQAMRVGEVAFVSPFRYSGLIAAMVAGVIVFKEIPTPLTLLGAFIVVATGLFTFYREQQAQRGKTPA